MLREGAWGRTLDSSSLHSVFFSLYVSAGLPLFKRLTVIRGDHFLEIDNLRRAESEQINIFQSKNFERFLATHSPIFFPDEVAIFGVL